MRRRFGCDLLCERQLDLSRRLWRELQLEPTRAVRGQAGGPDVVVQAVIDAARAALDLRDGLRAGVLALIRALAEAAVPDADRRARDRQLDDVEPA